LRGQDDGVVVFTDTPENIVERIAFYDQDSRPVPKVLSSSEKRWCVSDVRKDIAYFRRSYKKADVVVEVAGRSPSETALGRSTVAWW
jgi:shikimate kinase